MKRLRRIAAGLGLAAALAGGEESAPWLGRLAIDGEILHANTLEVAGLAFRDVNSRPRFAQGTLAFLDLEAKAYRGRVTGWYAIELSGEKRSQRGDFKAVGIDLAVLARSLGVASEQVAGTLDGWLALTIPVGDQGGITGRGEVSIAGGSLVQLPLLVNFLAGNPAGARGQDSLTARFELRDNRIEIKWLRLESPLIRLAARGSIGFDGRLEIEIAPRLPFSLVERVPLIGPIAASGLSRLAGKVARAYVRGHVTEPVVVIDAFGR